MKILNPLLSVLFCITILIFGVGTFAVKRFSTDTNRPFMYFPEIVYSAIRNPSFKPDSNILILGLDPRNDILEKTETTDTIILTKIDSRSQVKLISIPRDLWDYQTVQMVNQFYPQSLKTHSKFTYLQENFSRITGQNIDRTLVITTKNLIDLATVLGGVDVNLEKGFRDDKYPNPEYVADPTSNKPIYKTIEFPAGKVHLDATNITEFVRSRKGAETSAEGGTDIGRSKRQQLLIEALILKIKSEANKRDISKLTEIYNYWTTIETNLSDSDVISLLAGLSNNINNLKIVKIDIPTGENQKTDILYHPQQFINQQWVFIPQDKSYKSFQSYINISLNENNTTTPEN